MPLDEGADPRLPDPHGFSLELMRSAGLIGVQGSELVADATAAARQFTRPDFLQMDSWARGWLSARYWFDGSGSEQGRAALAYAGPVQSARKVLAWALGCLAHAGDRWYELDTFLERLHALHGHPSSSHLPYMELTWDPRLAAARDKERQSGDARLRAWWFSKEGTWYANALMVSLVALGLVERARLGRGESAPLGFRLTESGRAVFGAPEVAPPPEPAQRRCLVIQPNFDIVAYLDQAGARTAGFLGRIAESDSAHSGPIQTFRLTQTSVYQAEESGLSHAQIVEFLQQHSQRELPANVLRSLADWSGRRESLSIRSGVTVLAFPSTADRDAYLERHAGTACGEHCVLGSGSGKALQLPGALVSRHLGDRRRTLELDEQGQISLTQPLDLVQKSRLRRIAQPPRSAAIGWQLTAASMRRAAAGGLKPGVVHGWLSDHLARPAPPLIAVAIDAWLRVGRGRPLELADAVLLHIPEKDQFQAIATSPRLRPFLLARPGPGWLVVHKETRKELTAVLEELGFTMARELTHDELPAITRLAGTDPK